MIDWCSAEHDGSRNRKTSNSLKVGLMVGFQGHLVQHGGTGTVAHLGVSDLTPPNAG